MRQGRSDSFASNIDSSFFSQEAKGALLIFKYAQAYTARRNIVFLRRLLIVGCFLQLRIRSLMLCDKEHPILGDHPFLVCSGAFRVFLLISLSTRQRIWHHGGIFFDQSGTLWLRPCLGRISMPPVGVYHHIHPV